MGLPPLRKGQPLRVDINWPIIVCPWASRMKNLSMVLGQAAMLGITHGLTKSVGSWATPVSSVGAFGMLPKKLFSQSLQMWLMHIIVRRIIFFFRASETWQNFDNSLSVLFHVLQVNVKLCSKGFLGKKSHGVRR